MFEVNPLKRHAQFPQRPGSCFDHAGRAANEKDAVLLRGRIAKGALQKIGGKNSFRAAPIDGRITKHMQNGEVEAGLQEIQFFAKQNSFPGGIPVDQLEWARIVPIGQRSPP